MAVRAMRQMWSLKRFRHQILNYGTILKIVMCLYKILKIDEVDEEEECEKNSKFIVLKRQDEPDRCISKEKLEKIIEHEMELQTQTNFEFIAAEKKRKNEFRFSDESKEVVSGILKFLLTITASSLPQVARGIFADGFGIKVLLFLTSEMKFRSQALKILSSFAYNSSTQEFLRCASDVVAEVCEMLIKNSKSLAASEQKCALAIVCLPSENACTRLKLRRSGIFRILLDIAATTKSEEELNLLIFAFYQFRFDEVGLEDLMRLNLVNVMIKILSDLMTKGDIDHIANDSPAIEDEKPAQNSQRKRLNDAVNFQYAVKYPRFENYRPSSPILSSTSPTSGSSSGYGSSSNQMSPTTSGYSPFNSPVRCYHDYDSDSNQYSPVCSDNEQDLDRIEAKVIQIIEKKKADGHFEVKKLKPAKRTNCNNFSVKIDCKKTSKGEEKIIDVDDEAEEEEGSTKKDDFDILAYIYGNDEIGRPPIAKKSVKNLAKETENLHIEDNSVENHSGEDDKQSENTSKSKKPENFPETLLKIEEDRMQFVLLLIWKVSLKYSDAPAFVQAHNLETLVKVCRVVRKPNGKIYQILQNVVEQTRNFVSIFLKQNLVFDIFSLSGVYVDHHNCYSCDKMRLISRQLLLDFSKVGESGYGQGEIVHSLLTGDLEMKRRMAVKLLFVVSSSEMLNNLLFHHGALDIVFEVIFSNSELAASACDGITIMSENLCIKIPSDDESLGNIIPDDFEVERFKVDDAIKFILKDGEITVDKSILMDSSEVFSSMLSSDFRESNRNEIKFPTYTVAGMKYFYQILMMQREKRLKSIAPRVKSMEVLLQSFELSVLYALMELQQPLLNVIKIVISEANVMKVFEWSLRNVNQELLISSICCFLCAKIDGKVKLKLFIEANASQFSSEWKKLIVDSISMKCRPVEF